MPIEARVGVNTGEVVVRSITTGGGHVEYTPIGHTTNLASRMQALAPTGSIAISEQTRKLVEGYFSLKPLGPTKVKGVSEPVNVYEVTGLGPLRTRLQRSAGRGLTKFVGREREMDAMRTRPNWRAAGHGQLVAAMARAGRRQVAPVLRVQGDEPVGLDGAGDVLGLARQGVGLFAGDRSAARLFQDHRRRRRAHPAREGDRQRARRSIARWKTLCRICSRCSESSKARSAGADGRADSQAPHARRDQADSVRESRSISR